MYLVLSVSLLCVWFKLVSCASQDPSIKNVVNFNLKSNYYSDGSVIAKCMPERDNYKIRLNEDIMIKFHHDNKYAAIKCHSWDTEIQLINEIDGSPNEVKYYIPSVGHNLNVFCNINLELNTTHYALPSCDIIMNSMDLAGKTQFLDYVISKNIYAYLTVDPKVPNTMRNITYVKGNFLYFGCIEPDDTNYTHVAIEKDNRIILTKPGNKTLHLLYYDVQEDHNNRVVACVVTDRRTNITMKSSITLSYRDYVEDAIVDTVIGFNSKFKYFDDGSIISECMPERDHYEIRANETVMIKLHHNGKNVQETRCDAAGGSLKLFNETVGPLHELNYYIPSVDQEMSVSCSILLKLNTTGSVQSSCKIYVKEVKIEGNLKIYNHIYRNIHVYLTVDAKVPDTMKDITFVKDSSLYIECIEPDSTNYMHALIVKENGGKSTTIHNRNSSQLYENMDDSFNNMEVVCVVTDKRTNNTIKAGITLRYEDHGEDASNLSIVWILLIALAVLGVIVTVGVIAKRLCYKFKDKQHAHVQISTEANDETNDPTINENGENPYDFVYDNVYEDRNRMERAAREAQERSEAEQQRPPTPPPIKTIPRSAPVQQETQPSRLRRYSMLTPSSDMYLLEIDSEGYQIPEEVQIRAIQLDINSMNRET